MRPAARWIAIVVAGLVLAGAGPTTASAATGDLLRQIVADQSFSCTPDVGIAFDGRDLFVTCALGNVIDVVRTSDGSLIRQITVSDARNLAAASFDRTRGQLLVCSGFFQGSAAAFFESRLVDRSSGASQREFFTNGCAFGLAADAADDTVYAAAAAPCRVDRFRRDGTLLASHDVCALGAQTPSGLAVGTRQLFLGSFGGGVYVVDKGFTSASLLIPPSTFPVSALACDDVTFAPKTALWVGTGIDRVLRALEVPAGSCVFGGGVALPTSKEQCKSDGWRDFGFRNQGQCVSFVATGGKKPPPG